ncbi:serine hydrolase domain-containing protein [Mycobacteroides chelonae]|uniref:Beta-lactamase-related domain-containing protein n=1 Tax=Mycobacteroides chelonae TaxID=1774 RepID=A0AB73LEH6_MYCCH|nr:serine hydrolase domain-containing protein [Mycobacteroides chelonae]MBF9327012.1 beta-lactamase family protein [Mycobacteroides chelonae]MBF9421189.1 beta-lactamase family protein [Mycobacteroides chelonae]MBF9436621.1 beta-lactamase family protein [Mycobacteroides chelonae]MBV6361100.1 beta-lactamase family protein [Mycobacteroides chelonae]MEC4833403.1 serine hydrolase domain-containing protein [Mycobacteroides chelonae]
MTAARAERDTIDSGEETSMIVDSRFIPLAIKFFRVFRSRRAGGGALAVFLRGRPVLDIWAGDIGPGNPWRRDTMAMSYSTGKGVAATVIHRLADRGLIDYEQPVADYWPEFGSAGKGSITVRELLNHRAGLHRERGLVPGSGFFDHDTVAAALAASSPDPRRLRLQGYHTVSFGTLVAELAQRVTNMPFPEIVQTELSEPLGEADFWFRVPREERARIAPLFPAVRVAGFDYENFAAAAGRYRRGSALVESIPAGLVGSQNHPSVHDAVQPGWNGVFTARALAKMYGALANAGEVEGIEYLRPGTVEHIAEMRPNSRYDYVLGVSPHHWLGYHRALLRGGPTSSGFGHYGTGGSGGMAFPASGLAIAFVTNHLGSRLTAVGDLRLPTFASIACRLLTKTNQFHRNAL